MTEIGLELQPGFHQHPHIYTFFFFNLKNVWLLEEKKTERGSYIDQMVLNSLVVKDGLGQLMAFPS